MAANRRGSTQRTSSNASATQSSPNVEDASGGTRSYDDPTEADLQDVMADLMSNDLPFSDLVVSQAYLRAQGEQPSSSGLAPSDQGSRPIAAESSSSGEGAQSSQTGREQRKKEQNRKAQRAFRERKEQVMRAQSLEIEQLQRDLERANKANESMRGELDQLKRDASGTAAAVESREGIASPKEGSPSDKTAAGRAAKQ